MSNENSLEMTSEEQEEFKHQVLVAARNIHEKCEDLISEIEALIDLTGGDLALTMDDLKRVVNFLDAVIEAYPIRYRLTEITEKLKLDEATVRELFRQVGVEPEETVTERDVITLLADRAGSREGELLAELLRGDSPRVVWG